MMSSSVITKSFKPLSMADSFSALFSPPTIFTTASSEAPYPILRISTQPVRLNLSLNSKLFSPSFLSLKHKTHFAPIVCCVAQTSDWAQQEEDDTFSAGVEGNADLEFDNPANGETEAKLSADETIGGEDSGSEGFPEPPEDAKLFVGNLPYDVDSQSLAMLFEKAGVVEISEVIYNRETDQSRGFGFVTMSTVEEAKAAAEKFNRYELNGRLLTVNKAAPRGSRAERPPRTYEPSYRVYVGNIPWDVDNARLEQLFSEHGKVVDARVVYDRESGRSRGFGFVTMSNETELNDAIAALDGKDLGGRAIRVNLAEDRRRGGGF